MACCYSFFCCFDRNGQGRKNSTSRFRIFSLKELQAATNYFNYDNKLGEGGFGSVYWGQLWDGSQIAVKRLKVWSSKPESEIAVDLEILGKMTHKNLLSLRGYCSEGQERLIVYDYMSNLSLHSHLHSQSSTECDLDWGKRVSIAIGSAEGILYLHNATPRMIHGDLKTSNILLDAEFRARIADFGFAKLLPGTHDKGKHGYLAPEISQGQALVSSDVYSFGIILLILASGKKPIEKLNPTVQLTITEWALPLARQKKFEEIADSSLNGNYNAAELKRMVFIGLLCTQTQPEKRPTMLEVVDLLKVASKEKISRLENDELFRPSPSGTSEASSSVGTSSDFITEERDTTVLKSGTA